jgi:hypothetical protein
MGRHPKPPIAFGFRFQLGGGYATIHIHAWRGERDIGTFEADTETKREAFQKARWLQQQGFSVLVTGPDGKPVKEDDD